MWQISIFFYKSIYARFKKQLPESACASAVDTGSKHNRLQSSGIRKQLPNQCMLITISTLCVNALQRFSEVKLNIFSWGLIILLSLQPVNQIKIIMKKEFKWHWWTAEVVNVLSDIFSTNNLHRAAFLQCTIESWNPFWQLTQPRPAGFICSASVDCSEKRSYASNSPFRTDKKASNANGHKIKLRVLLHYANWRLLIANVCAHSRLGMSICPKWRSSRISGSCSGMEEEEGDWQIREVSAVTDAVPVCHVQESRV